MRTVTTKLTLIENQLREATKVFNELKEDLPTKHAQKIRNVQSLLSSASRETRETSELF